MAMSKDRVLFFLPRRYFLKDFAMTGRKVNGLRRTDCLTLLQKSFGVPGGVGLSKLINIMEANPDGFYIRCRPSQFARFIVYRMEILEATTEASNGIRDLQPILEVEENPRVAVAEAMRIEPRCVDGVLAALDLTLEGAYHHIKGSSQRYNADVLDYSRNAAWNKEEML